jgi:hypothetical protein
MWEYRDLGLICLKQPLISNIADYNLHQNIGTATAKINLIVYC